MATKEELEKAKILAEALPYMRTFTNQTFVIKYGGSAMGDPELAKAFARDIVLLKQVGIRPIVVHGGGPQISAMLEKLKIKSNFVDGLRITDGATVEVVEMVLSGTISKAIVASITEAGGMAVGISGKDGGLIKAKKVQRIHRDPDSNIEKVLDMGFVGEPEEINPMILDALKASDIIPVIAPVGQGENGETYNINADSVAGALASALGASKLIILTDVPGVLDKQGTLLSKLTVGQAKKLMEDKTVSGGMIPKIETCIDAVSQHTKAAHILDGRIPHVVLLEIFTKHGSGTMIVP